MSIFTSLNTVTGRELYDGLKAYFANYNSKRLHQSLGHKTPEAVYMAAVW